jgi:tRNA 2-thiouridine synthesizing protein A
MSTPPDPLSDDAVTEVDALGLLCPLPVLRTRKRLQPLAVGALLRVRADDPAALVDVPHFCAEQGHALVSQCEEPDGVLVFLLRKGG